MENNANDAINKFLNSFDDNNQINDELLKKDAKSKNVIIKEREGLIERIDKIFVTSDGRQLLRERY